MYFNPYLKIMKKLVRPFLLLLLIASFSCSNKPGEAPAPDQKIIVGYVPGFRGLLDELSIDAHKLTHINYAFVNVQDSMAWLTNLETDTANFRILNQLKEVNPDLKILISIGGWSWSGNFSDAVLTPGSRAKFARTSVEIVANHDLDGVDIDWEYPGQIGDNNVFRPEDKQNYTLMFEALRKELDGLSKITGKYYELTTAVGANYKYIEHTEMDQAVKYLDFVNLMTYDFYTSGDTAGHHSNLYPPEDYERDASAHKTVQIFLEAGVPAEKLVMGVPFYGRSWIMKSTENKGINRAVEQGARGGGYTYIKDSLVNQKGFVRYWDEHARAPYLFNSDTRQLITYDDEESIRLKCEYVIDHHLAGMMFWQYASDPKEYLLDAMNEYFQ
jgi:chitinase